MPQAGVGRPSCLVSACSQRIFRNRLSICGITLSTLPHRQCTGPARKCRLSRFAARSEWHLAEAGEFSTIPPYAQGGNMDIRDMNIGVALYLPVKVMGHCIRLAIHTPPKGTGRYAAPLSNHRCRSPQISIWSRRKISNFPSILRMVRLAVILTVAVTLLRPELAPT